MLAHEWILQHVKTKQKPKRSQRKKFHENACCSEASDMTTPREQLEVYGVRVFSVPGLPQRSKKAVVLPCILTSSCHKAKALQGRSPYGIHTNGCEGFSGCGCPGGTPKKDKTTADHRVSHGRYDCLLIPNN